MREFLIWETHAGGLSGYFGRNKTIEEVEHQFLWSSLKGDVAKLVGQCRTCQLAKHRKQYWSLHPIAHSHLPLARYKYGFCA
jgi:hypothetical protein